VVLRGVEVAVMCLLFCSALLARGCEADSLCIKVGT
jgi:hypothetical protein